MSNHTGNILVVDDNELNRDMLARRLRRRGYAVETAESGESALALLPGDFDLVLLDIMMPGVSGVEVLKTLRRTRSVAELPVIMVSAKDQNEDVAASLALGANDYITKPIDFKVLLARVESQLARSQAEAELRRSRERYEQIVEGTSDVVYTTDAQGRFSFFNGQLEKITGYSRADMLGRPFTEVLAPAHRRKATAFYLRQLRERIKETVNELPIVVRDGSLRWMEQKVTLLTDRSGQVSGFQAIVRDTTERRVLEEKNRRLREELQQAAIQDGLTGLYNRRYLDARLEQELDDARRGGYPLSLIMFDLDGFKDVNDRLSHLKGDEVLREVAGLFRDNMRKSDMAFRYGGDEFVLLLPDANGQASQAVARIHRAFQKWLKEFDLEGLSLGLSLGQVTWEPGADPDPDLLLKAADEQLYRDKSEKDVDKLRRQLSSQHKQLKQQSERVHFQTRFLNSIGELIVATDLEGRVFYANQAFGQWCGRGEDELTGQLLFEAVPAVDDLVRQVRRRNMGQVKLPKSAPDDGALLFTPSELKTKRGRLYGYVYVGSDISELEKTHQRLAQTHQLLADLNAESKLEPILQLILDQAVRQVPNADSGSVQLLNETTDCLEFVAAVGWDINVLQRVQIPRALDIHLLQYGDHPAIIQGGFGDFDEQHFPPELLKKFAPLGGFPASTITAPIRLDGEVIGKIHLDCRHRANAFDQNDIEQLSALLPQVELAIRRAAERSEMEQMTKALSQNQTFLEQLNAETRLERVFQLLLDDVVGALEQADSGSALMLNERSGQFEFIAAVGWNLNELRKFQLPSDKVLGIADERQPALILGEHARRRKTFWQEKNAPQIKGLDHPQSSISLPIRVQGRTVGFFNIDNRTRADAFSQQDLDVVSAKLPQMQLAVKRARQQENAERLTRELRQNQTFLERLNAETQLDGLMQLLLDEAIQLVPNADSGSARLLNEQTQCYEFAAATGWDLNKLKQVQIHTSEDFFHRKHSPAPLIIWQGFDDFDRLHMADDKAAMMQEIGYPKSSIVFPIMEGNAVIGNFNINSKRDPDAFDQSDIERVSALMPKFELAIKRIKERARQLTLTQQLSRQQEYLKALNAETDPVSIIKLLLDQALAMLSNADSGSALLLNESTGMLEYVASVGWDLNFLQQIAIPPQDHILHVRYQDEPAIIEEDLAAYHRQHWTSQNVSLIERVKLPKSYLCLPIRYQGGVVGYFNINNKTRANSFSLRDLEALGALSAQLELAFKRAKDHENLTRHQQRLSLVFQLGQGLARLSTIEDVARYAADWACEHFHYELVGIAMCQDDVLTVLGFSGSPQAQAYIGHSIEMEGRTSLAVQAVQQQKTICVNDVRQSKDYLQLDPRTRADLATPIVLNGESIGVLNLESFRENAFGELDIDLALFLANQLSIAFSNIRRGEQLQESERRYRQLVESVQAIVWRANVETFAFTYVSPEAEALLGYPISQWVSEPGFWQNHTHPEDREWAMGYCQEATQSGEGHEFDYRMLTANGRVVWLRDFVNVLKNAAGQPQELVGVMVDITEQKQAEIALRESEAKFSSVFDHGTSGIAVRDARGGFTDANASFLEIFGYTLEELKQLGPMDLIHPEDQQEAKDDIEDLLQKRKTHLQREKRYIRKDGRVIWGFTGISAVCDDEGNVRRLIAMVRDVTDRKKAQQALEHRLAFETLLNGISSRFVGLSNHELDEGVCDALAKIGAFMNVERTYLTLLNDRAFSRSHEWCAPGVRGHKAQLQDIPASRLDWWMASLRDKQPVRIDNVNNMPAEARAERQLLEAQGVKSSLIVPLVQGVNLVGYFGLHNVRQARAWDDDDIKLLNVVTEIIANALERSRASRALKRSEARYRDLVENISDVLFTLDAEWAVTFVSPVLEGVAGYLPDEVIGKRFIDFVYPEDLPGLTQHLKRTLLGETSSFEFRVVTKLGRARWVRATCRPLERKGQVIGVRGVLSDVHQQKQAEARETDLQRQLETTAIQTATMLSRLIDEKDPYTAGHCQRLADFATVLGSRLGLSDERLYNLKYAALLHDLGKIGVPEHILNKPSELDGGEWERMKHHVQVGVELVSGIHPLKGAAAIIAQHHERWDGSGYPHRLRAEQILLEARILSVVDAFDAMTTDRPYRKALPSDEVLSLLESGAGAQWDPKVVNCFLACFEDIIASVPSHRRKRDSLS